MNNRYLYRAKHVHALPENEHLNGRWIEVYLSDENYIYSPSLEGEFLIDPSTICQCTGERDEDRKLIFEHDIVGFLDCTSTENGYSEHGCAGEVLWDDETLSFQVTGRLSAESYEVLGGTDCKVLGNSFDNQELLEVY